MSEQQVIERIWKAPMALVWELWTTPEGLASWWGPKGFTVEVDEYDLRVGGAFAYTMKADSRTFSVKATFTEVEAPRRLAYRSPFGAESLTTAVTFSEVEGGVKMVLTIDATKPGMTGGAARGWASALDCFAERLGTAVAPAV